MNSRSVAIVGATATGKSRLALEIARLCNGEIINADSRQTIRGLTVGTAAPDEEALGELPHHLYAIREPGDDFTAFDWLTLASPLLDQLASSGGSGGSGPRLAVVVGGTGLYISALIDGLDPLPPSNPGSRQLRNHRATEPLGLAELVTELTTRLPDAAASIDLNNPRRVIRALEILDGAPDYVPGEPRQDRFGEHSETLLIGLQLTAESNNERIASRAEAMIASGCLVAEIAGLLARGIRRDSLSHAAIGYAEGIALLDGSATADQTAAAIVQRTRRYAKAQRTYFRRNPRIHWLNADLPVAALLEASIKLLAG